jgi:putative membrane protein
MTIKNLLTKSALIFIFGATSSLAFAADKIDADDFVDEASAKGIAEVESAKLALEKSKSADVQAFAQKMITDHSSANMLLAGIAARKNLEVSDEAELTTKAKKFVLEQRDGESFDEAYANNQVEAHKDTIELFEQAAVSDDAEIAAFSKQTLPKLKQHLQMAKTLAAKYDNDKATTNNSAKPIDSRSLD